MRGGRSCQLETARRLYEAMFLVDSGMATSDWEGVVRLIETILKRADAEVLCLRKWSDRRLTYEIQHKTRGMYILCYFKAEGRRIAGIERDIRLSEQIMRSVILAAEDRPAGFVERDLSGQYQVPDDIHLGESEDADRTSRRPAPAFVEADASEGKAKQANEGGASA